MEEAADVCFCRFQTANVLTGLCKLVMVSFEPADVAFISANFTSSIAKAFTRRRSATCFGVAAEVDLAGVFLKTLFRTIKYTDATALAPVFVGGGKKSSNFKPKTGEVPTMLPKRQTFKYMIAPRKEKYTKGSSTTTIARTQVDNITAPTGKYRIFNWGT
jgi:hypothetical protein